MIIDGGIVSVGSANIDVRSFRLDFEVNTLVYDERMASRVRKAFLKTRKFLRISQKKCMKTEE